MQTFSCVLRDCAHKSIAWASTILVVDVSIRWLEERAREECHSHLKKFTFKKEFNHKCSM